MVRTDLSGEVSGTTPNHFAIGTKVTVFVIKTDPRSPPIGNKGKRAATSVREMNGKVRQTSGGIAGLTQKRLGRINHERLRYKRVSPRQDGARS